MRALRLLADDLTGALDTAAAFAARIGPLPVFPPGHLPARLPARLPRGAAIATGLREQPERAAAQAMRSLASFLAPRPATLSFLKLDSLLRGHPTIEIAACIRAAPARPCIVAPAFPLYRRLTRLGRQYVCDSEEPRLTGADLPAGLVAAGVALTLVNPGDPVPPGASLWDAETEADLCHIAEAGVARGAPILWCGSAGLAQALAGPSAPLASPLALPLLGLFGSNHPATTAQLAACSGHVHRLSGGEPEGIGAVRSRLGAGGIALTTFALPPGISRSSAARRIADALARLLPALPRPASLLVVGGETLAAVCAALGTHHLEVSGALAPGVPCSHLMGGLWDGLDLVSKSGAFGEPGLLATLLAGAAHDR
ncbi:MAG: four-carbon acid sugar kinase family protein [Acetobacteraceae bacterium]